MHCQKNSEIRRDLTETRCALATPTCLQHPERLAEARLALISSAPPSGSHHHDQCSQYRAHDHENADDLPSLFFMTRHCCRPPRASHQPQQARDAENCDNGKPAHHGEHLFVPTRHRAPPSAPKRPLGKLDLFHRADGGENGVVLNCSGSLSWPQRHNILGGLRTPAFPA